MSFNLPPKMSSEQRAERLRLAELDGRSARAEYDAAKSSENEKTERLRAVRLERDRAAAAAAPPPAVRKKPAAKPKRRNVS